jgi:hypothetical protein
LRLIEALRYFGHSETHFIKNISNELAETSNYALRFSNKFFVIFEITFFDARYKIDAASRGKGVGDVEQIIITNWNLHIDK